MNSRWSLFLLGAFLAGNVSAACVPVAHITTFEGQISVKPAGKVIKTRPAKTPAPLCAGDQVHTFQGKALIKSTKNDVMALGADSVLTVNSAERASVDQGQALFDIQKREAGQGLLVATRLSVIGVKGTRFLVSDRQESVSVVLDEGVVDVKSTKGKLGFYREKEAEQKKPERTFESFKSEIENGVIAQNKAFEDYTKEIQREFIAHVENVIMTAGTELSISGNEAVERKTSANLKAEIAQMRQWMAQK